MARAPKVCSDPRCPNLQPCPDHQRKPWAGAGRKMPPGWAGIRARILRRDPVCRECREAPSTEVDHIARRDDHTDANLRGLCSGCHREKTQREAAAARRRVS